MSANNTGELEGPDRLLGQRILDFVLKDVLGAGGMSVVYRGEHRVTGQEVAIKILPPELAVHDDLKARFVEEARVLAKLEHPNIVGLNNFTESGGRLCLIMSYVPGKTFEQLIVEGGKLEPREVVRIGVEVCKALEYAHGQNVIHRDIKPSNVLVRPDGAVKVTDFGIAKIMGQTRLTSTGQTMGTVRYMSPEQVRGRALDSRSDLYSLGITLYEALAGKTPFEGDNQFDIMQQQINKAPPSLSSQGVEVPPSLERVLKTALEKDPNKRQPDAKTIRESLDNLMFDSENTPAGTPRAKRGSAAATGRTRAVALGLGLGVAVVGGVAGLYRLNHHPVMTSEAGSFKTPPAASPAPSSAAWPAPHAIRDLALAVDQTFAGDQLRVQSAAARDVSKLRERVQEGKRLLQEYLATSSVPAAQKLAARFSPPPLTVTVIPAALLSRADLWPGFGVESGKTYGSRYVEPRKTLFVADTAGFERRELAYGLALHVLAPEKALTTDECLDLADKFEAWYLAHAAP